MSLYFFTPPLVSLIDSVWFYHFHSLVVVVWGLASLETIWGLENNRNVDRTDAMHQYILEDMLSGIRHTLSAYSIYRTEILFNLDLALNVVFHLRRWHTAADKSWWNYWDIQVPIRNNTNCAGVWPAVLIRTWAQIHLRGYG